jgi:hypothetical protein
LNFSLQANFCSDSTKNTGKISAKQERLDHGRPAAASSMRQNWLSNSIFKSFDDIVDRCCYAWNILIGQPWKIISRLVRRRG